MSASAGKIAVLDFGGQYTQLIARRVREMSVYSEIFSCTHPLAEILSAGYQGIILSGGPSSVYEDGAPLPPKELFDAGIPVLGICYGMQAMGYLLGGHVIPAERREYGKAETTLQGASPLLRNVEPEESGRVTVWMSHGDTVLRPPKGFTALAKTQNCPVAAMADESRRLYAVQFHPEVLHTPQGRTVLDNFLTVCGVSRTWSMAGFIDTTIDTIRTQVGGQCVLCALSGGIDSSVVALLVHRAIGDQLTCVFVDNGLLRKGEAESVVHTFRDAFKMNLIHVSASRRFLDAIHGVTDPEIKRKRIGAEFIAVFDDEAKKLGDIPWLAQGTLYPDVIESVSFRGPSATIKTHHNVGGLPLKMQFKLVEPLRELFKDEVRKLGELLGLPQEIVWRQPFPGPGLAIRVLGEVRTDRRDLLREADAVVQEEVRRAGLERLAGLDNELKLPAIPLPDHGNLFRPIDLYNPAQKAGVKPILGCELYVAPGGRKERGSQDGGYEGANHLTVLVRNRTGYKNLVKLVSRAFLEGFYYKPRVDRELLAQHADGLLVLSGCLNSEVSRILSAGDAVRARETAGWYQEVFGKDHYFMEVQAHGLEEQERVMAETLRIAKSIGAPAVGTNDSHYLEGGHAPAPEAPRSIQGCTNLQDIGRFRFSTQEFYIKSAEEMARVFADLPEACRNTLAVAERCNLTLDFNQFHLPRYVVPSEHTLDSYLHELAHEGLKRRYASP